MHSTQINTWLTRMALVVLSATTLFASGCARMYHMTHYNAAGLLAAEHHRSYFHSLHTGRIIAKEHGHFCPVEPPCFGFEPTCWSPWPAECPQQCNQPCLVDAPILMEEVVSPEQSIVSPEQSTVVPEETPEEPPADEADSVLSPDESVLPSDESISPSDEPAVPLPPDVVPMEPEPPNILDDTTIDEDAGWSEVATTLDPDEDEVAPPLQKQPLAEQLVDEPVLPSAEQTGPAAVWEANIARREIDQQMVLVEETGEALDHADDSALDLLMPQLVEVEEPSTTEQVPEAIAGLETSPVDPIADAEEPQPQRLALRTQTPDRPLPPQPQHDKLPADTSVKSTASEPLDAPAEARPKPKPVTDPPIAETTTGSPKVPSFKITAKLPPSRDSSGVPAVITVSPPNPTSKAIIRFASESPSSLRVGTAKKTRTETSLRFR